MVFLTLLSFAHCHWMHYVTQLITKDLASQGKADSPNKLTLEHTWSLVCSILLGGTVEKLKNKTKPINKIKLTLSCRNCSCLKFAGYESLGSTSWWRSCNEWHIARVQVQGGKELVPIFSMDCSGFVIFVGACVSHLVYGPPAERCPRLLLKF